jgi:hypothetical protein
MCAGCVAFVPAMPPPCLNLFPDSAGGIFPEGKSDVVQSRQDGGFYPTRGSVAQNEIDKERDEETERGL